VVIMTSNVGGSVISKQRLGFTAEGDELGHDALEKRLVDELRKAFRPEFLNRVDEIIVFDPLTREEIGEIVELQLARLRGSLRERGIELELTAGAREVIAETGWDPQFGARPLKRALQRLIENPLALELLEGRYAEGAVIRAHADRGAIVFAAGDAAGHEVEEESAVGA
jgi:ATP-dependent Clp protease ATP-binding subunit ClpA